MALLVLGAGGLVALFWPAGAPVYPTILHADRITVYEGLPHPMYEEGKFRRELQAKATVQLHGFPFYREPLELKRTDVEALRGLLGTEGTYVPYGGEKKCGGFHPDYAVEWTSGRGVYHCLICFGCSEAKVYGPRGESTYDLRSEGVDGERMKLRDLLKVYRRNRPPHERFGAGPLAARDGRDHAPGPGSRSPDARDRTNSSRTRPPA